MITQTAYATREEYSWRNKATVLRDAQGHVLKIFAQIKNQTRKNTKQITLNEKTFTICWDNATNL